MAETNKTQDVRLKADIASFKASVAFLLFCAVIFFTVTYLPFERGSLYIPIWNFFKSYPFVLLVFPILLGLSCLWKYLSSKKNKDESYRYFASSDAIAISLFLLIFALTLMLTYQMSVFLTVIAGFALCYYVKHFFQKDFFVVTLLNLDIALSLWLMFGGEGKNTGGIATVIKYVFVIAAVIGFVGIIVTAFTILKNKKKYGAQKLSFIPIIISVVVGAALAALLYFLPATVTILVAEIALLIQFVGLGVYYTVRLLNQ